MYLHVIGLGELAQRVVEMLLAAALTLGWLAKTMEVIMNHINVSY